MDKKERAKLMFRVLLSPLVFCYGLILLALFTLFPLSGFVAMSLLGLLLCPFVWVLRKSGAKLNSTWADEPAFTIKGHPWLGHFVMATIYLWSPFAITWLFIARGELYTGD